MSNLTSQVRRHRLWMPALLFFLAGLGITFLQSRPEFERNLKNWTTAGVLLLAVLLTLVWFLFLSRFSGRTRLLGLALVLITGLSAKALIKVDGTADGTGMPLLVWRWAHKKPLSMPTAETATTTVATAADLKDVPQFWGPDRDGVVRDAHLLPDWKTHPPKELWRHAVGAGWSAFSVAGGRAYTQEQREEKETVSCYEVLTGRLIWAHNDPAHFSQWQSGDGPHATPTVYQGRVFAIGATGILNCLEASTGKALWTRQVLDEHQRGNLTWGVSASPLVFDDTVIVTGGQDRGANVFAYRAMTGEPLWQAGDDGASYASPILATLAGKRMVLSINSRALSAHDPATGKTLLNYVWGTDKMPKGAQPVILGKDRIFLSAGYGMGCQVIQVAAGPDWMLAATEVWKNLKLKNQFNSSSLRDGFLYGLDDGQLACVDAGTGDRKWKEGRFGSGQTLLVDDLIIVQSESGEVLLMSAKPEKTEEYGRIPALSGKTWNHPTLAGPYLLLRNDREAVCYKLPVRPQSDSK